MHLHPVIKSSVEDLKHNYMLAAPTLVASFVSVFISFVFWKQSSDQSTGAFVGLASSVVILFAHGVTLAMARELVESGATSLATAIDTGKKSFVPLISLSLAVTFLAAIGLKLFVVPGLAVLFFLLYAIPCAINEGAAPFEAMKHSFQLAMTHKHETFVLLTAVVLSILVLALVNALLSIVPLLGELAAVLLTGAYGGVISLVIFRVHTELIKK